MRQQYPAGLSPRSGSLVPPPEGVTWGLVHSESANPLVVPHGFGAVTPASMLTSAESLVTTLPWYVWAGLAVGAWWWMQQGHPARAPRIARPHVVLSESPPPQANVRWHGRRR